MPKAIGKRSKSSPGRRQSRRRQRHAGSRTPYTYVPPQSRTVRLVYSAPSGATETAAAAGGFHFFRLNSAYDVDTNLGNTAMPAFAEWSSFFTNYRVRRAWVRFEGMITGGSASGSIATICLVPNPLQPTLPSAATSWPVQPGAVHRTIVQAAYGGANKVTFDKRYDMASLFRVTPQQFNTDFDFTATTGSNPARQMYLALTILSNAGSTSTPMTIEGVIYVAMDVEFFNPVLLSS